MEILLWVQLKICDEKCEYIERMKEIVQMNYIKADIDFSKLEEKAARTIFTKRRQ